MKNMEPLAQTCMAQKVKPKILGKMHKPKINDKFGQKNEYRLFLLLTFTKEGDKITNANKMIYCVFVRCTKYKANHLTCFVRVSFFCGSGSTEKGTSFGMFQRHGGNLLFGCCLGQKQPCVFFLCFLIESAVITIFLGGYTVWQQQLNRQSRRMS